MLKLQYFGHLIQRIDSLEKPWCWERLKAGEGNGRRWDGWMASPTQWTWVRANSGSWWRTVKPGSCSPWYWKESDMTKWLISNNNSFKKVLPSWLWDLYQRSPLLTPSYLGVRISTWILQETQTFRPQHLLFSVSLFTTFDSPRLKRYPGRPASFLFCPFMYMGLMNCSMGSRAKKQRKEILDGQITGHCKDEECV